MTQKSVINININSEFVSAESGLIAPPTALIDKTFLMSLLNGVGLDKAEKVWQSTRTLAASATEDLDLSGGLTDIYGVSLTFTKIKAILIAALKANTNDVIVGNAAINALLLFGVATATRAIKPGSFDLYTDNSAAGIVVTAGTGDLLKILNGGGGTGVTYDIIVVGETT